MPLISKQINQKSHNLKFNTKSLPFINDSARLPSILFRLQSEKAGDYSIRTIPHPQSVDIKKYHIVDFSKLTHLTEKKQQQKKQQQHT